MNARRAVFIATSLDGFISRPDGRIDWLDKANAVVPAGEDCGYAQFMSGVDALVMGRPTFEQALSFAAWPYGPTPVFVMSTALARLPDAAPPSVAVTRETPAALVTRLSALGLHQLYVDGGLTIQSFLAAKLIDEITVTTIPVLIGSGKPLFGPLAADVHLEHISTRAFSFGFVQSKYRVSNSP